jgi:hypothetical protein
VHQTAVGTPSIEQQRQWIGENKRQMRVESACRRFGAQKL